MGFFSESLAQQLGNFLGKFLEYDSSDLGRGNRNFMRIRVQLDVYHTLKRKKHIMFAGNCSYVKFKYDKMTFFCFYCGRLGHNDSFYEAKMALGVEVLVMGWDLSLRAQLNKALAMKNIWLRKDGEEDSGEVLIENASQNTSHGE